VTVSHDVTVNGGGGANAYAQIGNGGGFVNTNAASGAHSTTSGDIAVTAPSGPSGSVTLAAGTGGNAYVQIGNGGYSINAPSTASPANFVISGNITLTDLLLTGGTSGADAYSQVGNGDIGGAGIGSVSGNIDIVTDGGPITLTQGTAPHSLAFIGNAIGAGNISGFISGYTSPQNAANGTIASLTSTPPTVPTDSTTDTLLLLQEQQQTGAGTVEVTSQPGPLEDLTGNSGSGEQESSDKSDKAADAVADSLDGSRKKSNSETYFGGLLTKLQPAPPSSTPHGVPPADADFSSWGNEAFWE
jgi:hypothetical protein